MTIGASYSEQVGVGIGLVGEDATTGNPDSVKVVSGAIQSYQSGLLAGEEGPDSPTASGIRMNNHCFTTKLASSTGAQVIGGGTGVPVYIKGITLVSTSAGNITIAGLGTPSSSPSLSNTIVIPAITTTTPFQIFPTSLARAFTAGCQITCATGADGLLLLVDWETIP